MRATRKRTTRWRQRRLRNGESAFQFHPMFLQSGTWGGCFAAMMAGGNTGAIGTDSRSAQRPATADIGSRFGRFRCRDDRADFECNHPVQAAAIDGFTRDTQACGGLGLCHRSSGQSLDGRQGQNRQIFGIRETPDLVVAAANSRLAGERESLLQPDLDAIDGVLVLAEQSAALGTTEVQVMQDRHPAEFRPEIAKKYLPRLEKTGQARAARLHCVRCKTYPCP